MRFDWVPRSIRGEPVRGTERLPIEAVVYKNVFLTNDCDVGSDVDDFPLPPQHRLPDAEAMGAAIIAVLAGDGYSEALRQQRQLRRRPAQSWLTGLESRSRMSRRLRFGARTGYPGLTTSRTGYAVRPQMALKKIALKGSKK